MSSAASPTSNSAASAVRLCLWPGVVIVAALWAFFEVLPRLELESRQFLFFFQWGAMGGIALFVVWWLFFSRAPWLDRIALLVLCVAAGIAVGPFIHRSADGYRALMYVVYAIPVVAAAWMIWLVATPFLSWRVRRAGLWLVVAVAWVYPTLLRLDGTTSDIKATVNFRWKPTPEEQFLAEKKTKTGESSANNAAFVSTSVDPMDWPGFRGLKRDGNRPGVRINADWQQQPPRLVWRQRVGPGWGSFTVVGNRLFTQEQRGEQETVVCYDADTGKEIWAHGDQERFEEAVGGPGPRGTPTFHEGKLYTFGATGRLDCLDAATGKGIWSKNTVADSAAKTQHWGYTASPVVAQGVVTVFAGGPDGKSVLGYKIANGDLAWAAGEGVNSYSSTHLARLQGVEQILMATDAGLTSFEPATGQIFWKFTPKKAEGKSEARASGAPITQPVVLNDSEVLYGTSDGGTCRIQVKQDGYEWSTKEVWASRAIKPYFNDMVIHDGFIYGFDGASTILFTCVNLEDGKTKWKERGYGGGQCLLLPDQNLILVLTENNEVALLEATPEKRKELYKLPLLKGVKSWSHPVVARGKLFIRNDEEAACYDVGEVNTVAAK